MDNQQEKEKFLDTLKGQRFYRFVLSGYGGESAYINIDNKAFEFWNAHIEKHESDADLVNYMTCDDSEDYEFNDLEHVPEEADFLSIKGEQYKWQWYEAEGEFLHQMGVEYDGAYITVEEVESADYNSNTINMLIEGESVSALNEQVGTESNWETEITDWGEPDGIDDQGDYVAQMFSSEKGIFIEGTITTVGDFNPNKLSIRIDEYPNGDEVINGLTYNDIELENEGGDTIGKGYYAQIWSNIQ